MSLFTTVISKAPKRNAFDLSFENLLTAEFGELIPVVCKEVLPGDKFRMQTEMLVKTAPLLAPVFSRIDAYLYTFFVPNRLVQSDWEEFITTGVDGLSTELLPPGATLNSILVSNGTEIKDGSLADYLNLPKINLADIQNIEGLNSMFVNLLSFGAYQKIYSDWFQDELLDNYEFESQSGGVLESSVLNEWMTKRYRAWRKDYFTSARPNTQLGSPVTLAIGNGKIVPDGPWRFGASSYSDTNGNYMWAPQKDTLTGEVENPLNPNWPVYGNTVQVQNGNQAFYAKGLKIEGDSGSLSINDLRRAIRLQEWQERNMRGGNRYIENIKQHFGVTSSDARLQRSQYLGGRKVPVVVSEIAQTSATDDVTPQGNLAGRAAGVGKSKYIKFFAEEHGFIITLLSIMPKAGYMQGLPKQYWRKSYLDYPWPLFGNLGEMSVKNGELYLLHEDFNGTFGYQSQYADMKFSNNEAHGSFRSNQNFWHNYRIFANSPNLNSDFIHLNGGSGTEDSESTVNPQNRIFPVLPDGYGHFYVQTWNDIKVIRALPKYGIPTI